MDNNKVIKSHFLTHNKFHEKKLTPMEMNLVTLAAKKLNSESYRLKQKKISRLTLQYSFKRQELTTFFGLANIEALARSLKFSCISIQKKLVLIENGQDWETFHLLTGASYKRGILKFQIPNNTAERMLDYAKGYSEIDLRLSLSLPSIQEKCILDFIRQFKDDRDFEITLKEYCEIIGSDFNSNTRFSTFRSSHIEKPIKRLIEASNGMWSVKEGYPKGFTISKTGRAYKPIDKITFKMSYNGPQETKPNVEELKITSDTVYQTLIELKDAGGVGQSTAEDLGLTINAIVEFLQVAAFNDLYRAEMGNAGLLLSNSSLVNT